MGRRRANPPKQDTICWRCTKPGTGGCCWDKALIPVPGWYATSVRWKKSGDSNRPGSYIVHRCPEFEPCETEADRMSRVSLDRVLLRRWIYLWLSDEQICGLSGLSKSRVAQWRRKYDGEV